MSSPFLISPAAIARSGRSIRSACLPGTDRDAFAAALKAQGVPTAIYYPKSMHQQTAYKDYPVADGGLPVSERLSSDVISLPMHAYLDEASQDRVIAAVRGFFNA
jgi:dTDP-4-amino-4,6-dideoxygalactose transaminase